jgi:hypothetical protein
LAEVGQQGYHFAFCKEYAYTDFKASFLFNHDLPHSDVGFIFRAVSKSDFYLLHFPCCGQAYRAQHFWVALSHMDMSGYLRLIDMKMINRVDSTNLKKPHTVDLAVSQDEIHVLIDKIGVFNVSGLKSRAGLVGLAQFNYGSEYRSCIANVNVDGTAEAAECWNEAVEQKTNWFYPCINDIMPGQSSPGPLLKDQYGRLLLYFSVTKRDADLAGARKQYLTCSEDGGKSWTKPEETIGLSGTPDIFSDGRLRAIGYQDSHIFIQDTPDEGVTWSEPVKKQKIQKPVGLDTFFAPDLMGRSLLKHSSGSLILFFCGKHSSTLGSAEGSSILTWGSTHVQVFSTYSSDNGDTWSPLINLDGTADHEGNLVNGNMDLTEVCAIEKGDGVITGFIRPIYSPWMWEIRSDDGGKTWQPLVRGPFPGYATSNLLRTHSGALVFGSRMPGLTLHASLDDGLTWDQGTIIDSGMWAMGSMIEVVPDLVLYCYMDSFGSNMRAQFFKVTDHGLEPGLF